MSAKELIEAAKHLAEHRSCECDPSVGIVNCMGCDVARLADHILATIREDDDEPVTRERLEADGWSKQYIRYRHCDSNLAVFEKRLGFVAETSCKIELCTLKSIGHLRRLVAALGE